MTDELYCHRQHGDENNCNDDQREVLLDDLKIAEEIPGENAYSHPRYSAYDVVGYEPPIGHAPNASNKRSKGPDDRHKARDDNRLAAVLFITRVRSLEVFLIQEPNVLAAEDFWTHPMASPVVNRVPGNRSDR